MDKRIKIIRKKLNLTQQEFADKLGISRGNIAAYEVGKNPPSNAVIKLICREFNISEDWLRNGIEPMKKIPRGGKLATYVSEITDGDDAFIQDLIEVYMELDETSKEALRKIRDGMIEKAKEREGN